MTRVVGDGVLSRPPFAFLTVSVIIAALATHAFVEASVEATPHNLSELNEQLFKSSEFLVPNVSSSPCSVHHGCPHASMVWATGTFTAPDVLTPASFLVSANLTLQLNLCCGYKFNGRLLREQSRYDTFLYDLLRSTPFHTLTLGEKRRMFPRDRVVIFDTQRQPPHRYESSHVPSAEEMQRGNDGDGDVIVLVTGAVGPGIRRVPLQQPPTTTALNLPLSGLRGGFDMPLGSRTGNSSVGSGSAVDGAVGTSADIQLRVSNVAIKCKCPHTLLVMPVLHARPDTLPPISIVGLGSHCGVGQKLRSVTPEMDVKGKVLRQPVIQLANGGWAASLTLQPALLPATLVHWIITDTTAVTGAANAVLNVSLYTALREEVEGSGMVQPQITTSGYFSVIPHHTYNVMVTVSRGAATQTLSGLFVLRLPLTLEGKAAQFSNVTQPHFGVGRRLRLSRITREREELKQAFAMLPDEGRPSHTGYWIRTQTSDEVRGSDGSPPHVPHNPFSEAFVWYPLTVGRNVLSYYVRDMDEVCEPVLLEMQELWAVQALLLEPVTSPVTVCDDRISLEAFELRGLLETMRSRQRMLIRLAGDLPWEDLARSGGTQEVVEGHFKCTESGVGPCRIATGMGGSHFGVLQMLKRGVAELMWVVRVEVDTSYLQHIEQLRQRQGSDVVDDDNDNEGPFGGFLDPSLSRVISSDGRLTVIEVRSPSVLIVRRMSALPRRVDVKLPMHERRLTVRPPHPVIGQHEESLDERDKDTDIQITGRWVVNPPISLISVDETYAAELNTSAVPNIRQVLPEGTLQFIAEDPGEAVQDKLLAAPYTSRCPPRVVEYIVSLVAVPAPPVAPEFVPVYTEDGCVALSPPREPQKDEEVRWDIRPCQEASAPPYFSKEKQKVDLTKGYNGSADALVVVCGVEVDRWCEAMWSARNLVGSVTQTFSLRRCQRPPHLLFHKFSGGDRRGSGSPIDTLALPSVEWLDGGITTGDESQHTVTRSGDNSNTTDETMVHHEAQPRYFARRVIPIAGYAAAVHYTFNYSGSQGDYEVDFAYEHDAAHQLHVTASHFARTGLAVSDDRSGKSDEPNTFTDPDDSAAATTAGPLLLRRFVRPPTVGVSGSHEHGSNGKDNNEGIFSDEAAYWEMERHHRDYNIDRECDARFSHNNSQTGQYMQLHGLSNSSNYPFQYNVRLSLAAVAAAAELPSRKGAAAEFARRGMCLSRPGNISFLALNPRGLVDVIGVRDIAFCESTFNFSRHPWLHTKYHYDFTWTCENTATGRSSTDSNTADGVMMVEKRSPTFSILYQGSAGATPCKLTVYNALTETLESETFMLKRVHPAPVTLNFSVLSDNWAPGNCPMRRSGRQSNSFGSQSRTTAGKEGGEPLGKHQSSAAGMRTHWIVGKRAVLHVDAPADGRTSQWRAVTVVPAETTSVGTQRLLDSIQIIPLRQPHPRAILRGAGGATVLLNNIRVPGMYTLSHQHLDPVHPNVCPNVTVTETLHVTHARVLENELTVCGDTAVLTAAPLPQAINCSFTTRWEVVSVQTADNITLTDETNFSGIKFEDVSSPHTVVKGLPFGIVTVRWSVYASARTTDDDERRQKGQPGILVDYDTVRLLVLTENLRTTRLVTLSSSVEMLITGSTLGWVLVEPADRRASALLSARDPTLRVGRVYKNQTTSGIGGGGNNSGRSEDAPEETALFVGNLPVGTTHLQYELHASPRLFGAMLRKRCPFVQQRLLTIERVSAFLSVNTTLDHECDAYSGRGRFSICLHAEGIKPASSSNAVAAQEKPSSSNLGVHLVAPGDFENSIKSSAERLTASGCSLPWWVARTTRWSDIKVDNSRQCISFTVIATEHHLQSKEVSHHLFLAQEHLSMSQPCHHTGGDFVPSEVIEGASTWSVGGSAEDSSWFRFRSRPAAEASDGLSKFLPFMNPSTLVREDRAMRPLLGQLGVADIVASELDISERTYMHWERSNATDRGAGMKNGSRSVDVVFHLDRSQPGRMASFLHATSSHPYAGQKGEGSHDHHQEREVMESFLAKCVRGTLRGSEVLTYWTEVNHPDGAAGGTAPEWEEYVRHVGGAEVTCEPLFASLEQLLRLPDDTESTLRSRRASFVPSKEQKFVSQEVVEQQLKALREEFRLTREGIDVTGLRPEVQQALARRRITKSQLDEIEKARREKAEKDRQHAQQQQQLVLTAATAAMTAEERFVAAARLYEGVTGEGVYAIRVKLPYYASFSVPHNLFLRTALHKDLICGTNISVTSTAPASLVLFSRVEVMDEPPAVGASPPAIKQCEVEGRVPTIFINVSGTRFVSGGAFPPQNVLLEELQNPDVIEEGGGPEGSTAGVGLASCLAQMRAGMDVSVDSATRKHLRLQLSPCPSFQMLSPIEYNEQQESGQLLKRLQLPRLLRITMRDALVQDSHTQGRTTISFVVEVRPTLALLHLRSLPSQGDSLPVVWAATGRKRPLLLCEADMRRKGVELGVELIGDTWNEHVGEDEEGAANPGDYGYSSDDYDADDDSNAPIVEGSGGWAVVNAGSSLNTRRLRPGQSEGRSRAGVGKRKRSPHSVALLNSFSIVEHHSFDSVHHLFLQQGGVYRSHFVSYFFSEVLKDPGNGQQQRLIYRYNDTFIGVRITSERNMQKDTLSSGTHDKYYMGASLVVDDGTNLLPPIRPFSTIEEILFAVPGIATECQGCLLADSTFFVAGDLTGLWSSPSMLQTRYLQSSQPARSTFSAPLRIPFYDAAVVPREWRFTTMCPTAALVALRSLWHSWNNQGVQPFLVMELVVYSLRDMLGGEVPLARRPAAILTSVSVPLGHLLKQTHVKTAQGEEMIPEIMFNVNTSAAARAYAMMAADFVRYGRAHVHSVHDYVRDEPQSGGALAVNGSVFLKVCVPAIPHSSTRGDGTPSQVNLDPQCSVVSFTHSLLLMEEPYAGAPYASWYRILWGLIYYPLLLLHHVVTAVVGYAALQQLPVRRLLLLRSPQDLHTASIGLTTMLFVALLFLCPLVEWLWVSLVLSLWAFVLYHERRLATAIVMIIHGLLWTFIL
ncbi:hypothetical protein, conserved [Trypanosoma brucei brucei TREU927]|uniref:Uncharacterized protein n=1 Tax=Trypanosoma brucei brucei (strain 927/4 GUTat10.1) TaxID=185431 RepID=Q57Y62_TRYB2|nr:hypothetical protein, conserved [Trypanosoma brucei brucei TREU927]AAX69457.1 hypothetical protein, conserved [Trypanosoma brucei]AAZ12728.1 hypothetical protein, conserved [Trypanosoma brucei brucei TREU927]